MNARMFRRMYSLFWRQYMKVLPIPRYCVNHCCGNWSSPRYCYMRYIQGKSDYPVCVRSAALFNLKKLPDKSVKQLIIEFE